MLQFYKVLEKMYSMPNKKANTKFQNNILNIKKCEIRKNYVT